MEIRHRSFSERTIVVALALLAVLALALAAWQLAVGATSSSATRSAPVKTTGSGQRYVEPDAQDRGAPIVPRPEVAGRATDSAMLAAQARQPVQSPDRVPAHGALP